MIPPLTEAGGQVGRKGGGFDTDGSILTAFYKETLYTTYLHVLKICYPYLREV